jgi:hypothetical protein
LPPWRSAHAPNGARLVSLDVIRSEPWVIEPSEQLLHRPNSDITEQPDTMGDLVTPASKPPIPWMRIAAESAAIVLSILLAFAIDAWWDGAQDRAEEQEILRSMEAEFTGLQQQLSVAAARRAAGLGALGRVLEGASLGFARLPATPVLDSAMVLLVLVPTFDWTMGALESVLSSGRLELIQDRNLRVALASWPGMAQDIIENESDLRGRHQSIVLPMIAAHRVPISRALSRPFPALWPRVVPDTSVAREAYVALFRDPTFMPVLEWEYFAWRNSASEYNQAATAAEEILELITAALRP